jgi:hypothetical protein
MVKHGRTMCITMRHVIFLMWMVRLTRFWQLFLLDFIVCCVGKPWGLPTCWCAIGVPRVGTWDASHHLCKKYRLTNGFAHDAFNWPRYLFLSFDSKKSFQFFPNACFTFCWGIWGLAIRWLMMGLTFALDLFIHGGFHIKDFLCCYLVHRDFSPKNSMVIWVDVLFWVSCYLIYVYVNNNCVRANVVVHDNR